MDDYHIKQAHRAMRTVVTLLERLDTGHDPELAAALAQFHMRTV